ncbi:MAG: hypothetical protein ACOYXC_05450 [Candidatus Rifleibacteriota bacterium]
MVNRKNKAAQIALATIVSLAGSNADGLAETEGGCIQPDTQSIGNANDINPLPILKTTAVARQKLIDALREMKNNPEAIEFHSAMCYRMAMPPETIEYSCPDCGKASVYSYNGFPGRVSRQIASIRRSLANLPVKITLNETLMCQHCSPDGEKSLKFVTECGKCHKAFSWQINAENDLDKLGWLFLNYPIESIDMGPGKGFGKKPELIKEMVQFVSGCLFCPECIKLINLEYEEK